MTTSLVIPPAAVLILGGLILPLLRERRAPARASGAAAADALLSSGRCRTALRSSAAFLGYDARARQGRCAVASLRNRLCASWPSPAGCSRSTSDRVVELAAAFCYAGSAIGVAFAGDLITVFVFWELMAIASTLVVWSAGPSGDAAPGMRYAVIHLLGGVLLMAGIAGEIATTGSIAFGKLALDSVPALADPGGVSRQRRRAAALGLAARRLSGELLERHGVPVGLHHQGRRLRPDARLSRAPSC